MNHASITGWGIALPDQVVTNQDLEARLDTSDEWIVERSGIRERRIGGTVAGLAIEAGRRVLKQANVEPSTVDLLVLATTTPDETVPASSSVVHEALGLGGGAFDLNAACSGFVYALVMAYGYMTLGKQRVLLIGSECLSRITDPDDRSTAVLFADGAAGLLLEAPPDEISTGPGRRSIDDDGRPRDRAPGPGRRSIDDDGRPRAGAPGLLGFDLGADGSAHDLLVCTQGGFLKMEGREVFRRAVRITVDSCITALTAAGLSPSDVSLFVPHQANLRIIEAAAPRLAIPMERTAVVLDRTGNTSSASVPIALAEAADAGRLSAGDIVLMSGFGAGMTWASAVVRWG